MAWDTKDPQDILYYTNNWERFLESDTIVSSTWEVEQGSVTLSDESETDTTTTVVITGGADRETQIIKNTIVTAKPETRIERARLIVAKDKPGGA